MIWYVTVCIYPCKVKLPPTAVRFLFASFFFFRLVFKNPTITSTCLSICYDYGLILQRVGINDIEGFISAFASLSHHFCHFPLLLYLTPLHSTLLLSIHSPSFRTTCTCMCV